MAFASRVAPAPRTRLPRDDRYRIEGKLTLPSEGFRSRLSDYVNQSDRESFAVEEPSVTPLEGSGETQAVGFMLVARRHVRLVLPLPGNSP